MMAITLSPLDQSSSFLADACHQEICCNKYFRKLWKLVESYQSYCEDFAFFEYSLVSVIFCVMLYKSGVMIIILLSQCVIQLLLYWPSLLTYWVGAELTTIALCVATLLVCIWDIFTGVLYKGLDTYIPPLTGKPEQQLLQREVAYWPALAVGRTAQVAAAHCLNEWTLDQQSTAKPTHLCLGQSSRYGLHPTVFFGSDVLNF